MSIQKILKKEIQMNDEEKDLKNMQLQCYDLIEFIKLICLMVDFSILRMFFCHK